MFTVSCISVQTPLLLRLFVLSINTTDQPMARMESASVSKSSLGTMRYMGRTEGEGEIFPPQM
jgi:hypothetical protein